jgi:hypothetical protein
MPRQKKIGKQKPLRVSVEMVRREHIDWDRFAWALLQHCRSIIETEEAEKP